MYENEKESLGGGSFLSANIKEDAMAKIGIDVFEWKRCHKLAYSVPFDAEDKSTTCLDRLFRLG